MDSGSWVALVGFLGGAFGYLWTRFDQRSARSRLKQDLEMLALAPDSSVASSLLSQLVDMEAHELVNRRSITADKVVGFARQLFGFALLTFLAAWTIRIGSSAFFGRWMQEVDIQGGKLVSSPTSVADWIESITSALLALGIVAVVTSILTLATTWLAKRRSVQHRWASIRANLRR